MGSRSVYVKQLEIIPKLGLCIEMCLLRPSYRRRWRRDRQGLSEEWRLKKRTTIEHGSNDIVLLFSAGSVHYPLDKVSESWHSVQEKPVSVLQGKT